MRVPIEVLFFNGGGSCFLKPVFVAPIVPSDELRGEDNYFDSRNTPKPDPTVSHF